MQHLAFHSGIFDTGFIPKYYPTGFDARWCLHDDPALLVSVVAFVYRAYTDRAGVDHWPDAGSRAHRRRPVDGGPCPTAYQKEITWSPWSHRFPAATTSSTTAKSYEILPTGSRANPCSTAPATAKPFTLQVERHKTGYSLFHQYRADFMVMSARAAELLALMPEKPAPDLSKFLLSPMPGLLRAMSQSRSVRT